MPAGLAATRREAQYTAREVILRRTVRLGAVNVLEIFMQWTTPQACDFRFGFEITMYVAAR